jgi:hypothetical protein
MAPSRHLMGCSAAISTHSAHLGPGPKKTAKAGFEPGPSDASRLPGEPTSHPSPSHILAFFPVGILCVCSFYSLSVCELGLGQTLATLFRPPGVGGRGAGWGAASARLSGPRGPPSLSFCNVHWIGEWSIQWCAQTPHYTLCNLTGYEPSSVSFDTRVDLSLQVTASLVVIPRSAR